VICERASTKIGCLAFSKVGGFSNSLTSCPSRSEQGLIYKKHTATKNEAFSYFMRPSPI